MVTILWILAAAAALAFAVVMAWKTIIGWKDVKSLEAYREGDLIKEAMDFMRKLGSESVMEAYPLAYPAEDDNIEI